MGLDQYAYVAAKAGQRQEWWDGAELDADTSKFKNPNLAEPRELAYWRKHPNLQGWMESLWKRKMHDTNKEIPDSDWDSSVNGVELELTWEDLDDLEKTIKKRNLPNTQGFFFGDNNDQHYYGHDLEFIKNARAEVFLGLKVFYNSSW